jgi:selenoprotein W-related protein
LTESILNAIGPSVAEWRLIPSSGGVFEIRADDRLIFSKKQSGRFPTVEEVLHGVMGKYQ